MSPIIGHTSGEAFENNTKSNPRRRSYYNDYEDGGSGGVSRTYADYGYGASTDYTNMAALISHTKKEYDHEDDNEDFHKFDKFIKELNEDSVHPDGKY